jgi:hypothetical protein
VIADGPGFAAYYRVLAAEPGRHLVLWSLRHPGRGKPFDPSDEAALRRRERELRDGGVWLDYSWVFVLRPLGEDRTRLLVRCRADLAPRAAWPLGAALGLVDAYETIGMLHGIKARAERLAVTGRPERADGRTRPRRAGQGRRDHGREADDRPGDDGAPPPHGRPGRAPAASLQHQASPVVDEQDRLVGIVSRGDLLRVFLRPDDEIDREISEQILGRPYVAAMSRSRSGSTAGSSASRGTHAPSTTWTCWSSW